MTGDALGKISSVNLPVHVLSNLEMQEGWRISEYSLSHRVALTFPDETMAFDEIVIPSPYAFTINSIILQDAEESKSSCLNIRLSNGRSQTLARW